MRSPCRHGGRPAFSGPWRKAAFLGSVALIFLTLNGPLHTLSDEYLFSAHMVQHMLLMLVMPSFLIMGLPPWLIRKAMERPGVKKAARFLTHPVVAFLAYNVTFIGWHIPQMYNWALVSHDLHIFQHLMFMSVAVMMWWPVVNPVPELERIPTGPLLMMYVFAFGIPSTLVSAFITLSDSVFYPWYELAPRVTSLSPLEDQRLGGLIMWIPGMLIFWVGISAVFFRWTKDEYSSWKKVGPAAVLAALFLVGPGAAAGQANLEARMDYNPKFRQIESFTLQAESSLAFRLSQVVSLKVSVRDNFDSGAIERGAVSNNDGQVLFGVLTAF